MKKVIIVVAVIVAVILIWGLIGSSQAAELGTTCDIGLGEDGSALCWQWHRNAIGQIGDGLQDLFDK